MFFRGLLRTVFNFLYGKATGFSWVAGQFCRVSRIKSEQLIREIGNGDNLALISTHRMGKNGLIEYCFGNESIVVHTILFVDIYATVSLRDFVFLLSKVILEGLKPRGKRAFFILRAVSGMSWEYVPECLPTCIWEAWLCLNTRLWLSRHFEQGGKTIVPEGVELICRQFEGVTWYLQKMLNVLYSSTPPGGNCTRDMIPAALDSVMDSFKYTPIWKCCTG